MYIGELALQKLKVSMLALKLFDIFSALWAE